MRLVKRAMTALPDNAASLMEDHEVARYGVVRVADEFVVDLMASACGVTYADAVQEGVETRTIEGVDIPLATKQQLIRMKDTIRESDKADVAFLKMRIEEERRRESGS